MSNFTDIMTKIYNQIAEIQIANYLPYYLFVSKDVYDILCAEAPRNATNYYLPVHKINIQFVEGLELVVYDKAVEGYILVKGIKVANAK